MLENQGLSALSVQNWYDDRDAIGNVSNTSDQQTLITAWNRGKAQNPNAGELNLNVLTRDPSATNAVKREMQAKGLITMSIYGGKTATHLYVSASKIEKLSMFFDLMTKVFVVNDGSKTYNILFRRVEFHPVTDKPINVEAILVAGKKVVDVEIPLRIVGYSKCIGLVRGGKLNIVKYQIPLRCNIDTIPSFIEVDISKFGIGKSVFASSLTLPEGVLVVKDRVVLSITGRGKKDDEATEVAATPAPAAAAATPKK